MSIKIYYFSGTGNSFVNAIHHWGRHEGVKYRHPEVKISDMF